MNFHISPMSHKKYSLLLIVPLFSLAIAMWLVEAYFGTLYGDLTRMGYLDEGDFGWQMEQPPVPAEHLKNYHPAEADILVIGDSFSMALIWQSRLAATGYKLSTLNWNAFKPCGLGQNIGEVIRQTGFKGSYVVLENIEHSFQDRMSLTCEITSEIKAKAYNGASPPTSPPASSPISFNREPLGGRSEPLGGGWVINALITKAKLAYSSKSATDYMEFGNATYRTRVVPIDGCNLFSHRLCNYGLFYTRDFQKKTFTSIDEVLSINRNLQKAGINTIWLVIPDKATVYLGYGKLNMNPYANIWNEFAQHAELTGPNLGEAFKQKSRLIKDFYKPNDVHLSTNGYLYLGDLMADIIKRPERDSPQHGETY
jgi:hypothetical protein